MNQFQRLTYLTRKKMSRVARKKKFNYAFIFNFSSTGYWALISHCFLIFWRLHNGPYRTYSLIHYLSQKKKKKKKTDNSDYSIPFIWYFSHTVKFKDVFSQNILLGSKDLRSKCFKTSICNVDKSWSKCCI